MLPFLRMLLPKKEEKNGPAHVATTVEEGLLNPTSETFPGTPTPRIDLNHGKFKNIDSRSVWLDEVPEEVALHIMSFLPSKDLGQLAQTSKYPFFGFYPPPSLFSPKSFLIT